VRSPEFCGGLENRPFLRFNAAWPRSGKIINKRSMLQGATGRRKSRPRKPTATSRNARPDEKTQRHSFCAWPKRKERHAQRWEAKLKDLGAEAPVYRDTIGRRLNRWWNKIAGAEIAIRPYGSDGKKRQEAEISRSSRGARSRENRTFQEFFAKKKARSEEKAHARVLRRGWRWPVNPRTALDKILKREPLARTRRQLGSRRDLRRK